MQVQDLEPIWYLHRHSNIHIASKPFCMLYQEALHTFHTSLLILHLFYKVLQSTRRRAATFSTGSRVFGFGALASSELIPHRNAAVESREPAGSDPRAPAVSELSLCSRSGGSPLLDEWRIYSAIVQLTSFMLVFPDVARPFPPGVWCIWSCAQAKRATVCFTIASLIRRSGSSRIKGDWCMPQFKCMLCMLCIFSCHRGVWWQIYLLSPLMKCFLQGVDRQCPVMHVSSPQWQLPLVFEKFNVFTWTYIPVLIGFFCASHFCFWACQHHFPNSVIEISPCPIFE